MARIAKSFSQKSGQFYNTGVGQNPVINEGYFSADGVLGMLGGPGKVQGDPHFPSNIANYSFGPAAYIGLGYSEKDFQNIAGFGNDSSYNVLAHSCENYMNAADAKFGGG